MKVTELLRPYVQDAAAKRFDPRRLARQAARNARGVTGTATGWMISIC